MGGASHRKVHYHQHAYRQYERGTVVIMIYHIISLFGRGITQKGALKIHIISMHIDNSREELLLIKKSVSCFHRV